MDEQERIFKNIIHTTSDGIVIITRDETVKFVNPAVLKLLNQKYEEILSNKFSLPYDVNKVIRIGVFDSNGNIITLEIKTLEIEWENENVYLITFHNITDMSERYQMIVEHSNDLISLMDLDENTIWANSTWKKTLGYPLKSHKKPYTKIHPEDKDRVIPIWDSFKNGKREFNKIRYRYKAMNGKFINLETTIKQISTENKSIYYVISHNITNHFNK